MSNLTIWWQTDNLEFIGKYARLDDDDHIFSDENANDEASDGFGNFIDDLYVEQSVCGYLPIENITKPKEGATHDDINCGISNEESDPENYLPECFNEQKIQYDESKNFHKRMENFKNDFDIYVKYSTDSFHFAILYGTRLELTGKRYFYRIVCWVIFIKKWFNFELSNFKFWATIPRCKQITDDGKIISKSVRT